MIPVIPPSSCPGGPAPPPTATRRTWSVGTLTYTSGGLVILFSWLLWGDFAWAMKERSVSAVVQLLLKKFEASDTVTALLTGSLYSALVLTVGPIVSYRSDRHRGKWGRRIPYLLVTTPIATLALVGLAVSPTLGRALDELLGARSPGSHASTLLVIGLFWTAFEFATNIANTVFYALLNDVVPRAILGRFFSLFRVVSLLAGALFNYALLEKAEAHSTLIFLGIGVLYGAGFISMCLKVREGEYPPPPPPESAGPQGFLAGARVYFRDCFSNPYYLWVFAAITLSWLALDPIQLFSLFFAKSVGMELGAYGKLYALSYGLSLVLSYFFGAMADRFHPLRVGIFVLVLFAAVTLWGGIFATSPQTLGLALVAYLVLSGAWQTSTASLQQRLFPREKYAQFASAVHIVVFGAKIILSFGLGEFLDWTGHAYRYTYFISGGLALLAVGANLVVYQRFRARGGPDQYVAPE